MNRLLYFIAVVLSAVFLFTLQSDEFLGSSILSYVVTTIAIFVILSFFYFYASFYKNFILYQLKELQKKTASSWYGWFSVNIGEIAGIFLFTSPYVIVIVSLIKGMTFLMPSLGFMNYVAIGLMGVYCMAMVFMVISCVFHSFKSKSKSKNKTATN